MTFTFCIIFEIIFIAKLWLGIIGVKDPSINEACFYRGHIYIEDVYKEDVYMGEFGTYE